MHTRCLIKKKIICTICGEYVTFARGEIKEPYFRHSMQNEETRYCELRSQIEQNSTIYEKVGLPLYLKKTSNSGFELYLGFLHWKKSCYTFLTLNRQRLK